MYIENSPYHHELWRNQADVVKRERRRRSTEQRDKKLLQFGDEDDKDYMSDPASYFLYKEHWSLDGG
ncbi:hypothetical protein ACFLYR_08730 [Chloroflexota bacterium]